ncbi:hypothetical protein SprV_0200768000 [Sparganum proliferum]
MSPDAPITLMVDASNAAVGAALQQHLAGHIQPLAFFSRKSSPAETRNSICGRDLLAVFLAVKHLRHFLGGRDFTVFTDHKPLSFALKSTFAKLNPREIRQLDYISQFDSDICHIDGSRDEVVEVLSTLSIARLQLSPANDPADVAAEQRRVGSPCDEDGSGLRLQGQPLTTGNNTILCDISTASHRALVPPSLRRKVFSLLHNLSHTGSRATDKPVSDCFVWPGMHKDLKAWTPACLGIRLYSHTHYSLSSSNRRDAPAVSPSASLRDADDPENWTDHLPLVLLGIRTSLKSDLDCSVAELVFDATIRLPGEMISPTPRGAVEAPTNPLHRL